MREMKWACVGCGQGVDYHGNPITEDERQAWCYDCAEAVDRVAKSMGGARCRNCGNSGVSPWTGKPCGCPAGRALARLQADNGVEVVSVMADETLSIGDHVRVIGPAATSPGDTFAIGKETTVAELRTDDEGHTVYACQIRGWGFVAFPRASPERLDGTAAQPADEPRAIVRAFALAMERKLAANDAVKGSWKQDAPSVLFARLNDEIRELNEALAAWRQASRRTYAPANWASDWVQDVLAEAADCANYLMMIADVVGALPPTDERGR